MSKVSGGPRASHSVLRVQNLAPLSLGISKRTESSSGHTSKSEVIELQTLPERKLTPPDEL